MTRSRLRADDVPLTLGSQAYEILAHQYRQLRKNQPKVIKDRNPEDLHQMRVALRRLTTALQVFKESLQLPKAARRKQFKSLRSRLGKQRDLDVLLEDLRTNIYPQLPETEQNLVDQLLQKLQQRRRKAVDQTRKTLDQTFPELETTYSSWLDHPTFRSQAAFPLLSTLPELLTPLLSHLLLHPGWLLTSADLTSPLSPEVSALLHDLRKTCKQVRYQCEFFAEYYGEAFHLWLQELKTLQEQLGVVQDIQVLRGLLDKTLSHNSELPYLHHLLQQRQLEALQTWQEIQSLYSDPEYRHDLYMVILHPRYEQISIGSVTPEEQ
ncbi:MAG: CHAD domain-containing protein [Synechococcaceae cyanobacterium SM2_3_1]|nr:CHAD domain-containing protein [Synechococcaceae cyanobacterium SM2_3_1]